MSKNYFYSNSFRSKYKNQRTLDPKIVEQILKQFKYNDVDVVNISEAIIFKSLMAMLYFAVWEMGR